jgi:hypothetical protein
MIILLTLLRYAVRAVVNRWRRGRGAQSATPAPRPNAGTTRTDARLEDVPVGAR